MSINIKVNGQVRSVDGDPKMPLLWVLRETLGLTGTKYGCGVAQCGACTVLLDGSALRSCTMPVDMVGDSEITTIEGLSGREADAVRRAWIANDVPQCGFCQSGQIVSATALLTENAQLTSPQIDLAMDGNICRCGTYARIRVAIQEAAMALGGEG